MSLWSRRWRVAGRTRPKRPPEPDGRLPRGRRRAVVAGAAPPHRAGRRSWPLGLERSRELRRPLLARGLVDGQGTVAGVAVLVEGVLAGDALEARGRTDGLDDLGPGRLDAVRAGERLGEALDDDVGRVVGLGAVGAVALLEAGRLVVGDELLGALQLRDRLADRGREGALALVAGALEEVRGVDAVAAHQRALEAPLLELGRQRTGGRVLAAVVDHVGVGADDLGHHRPEVPVVLVDGLGAGDLAALVLEPLGEGLGQALAVGLLVVDDEGGLEAAVTERVVGRERALEGVGGGHPRS